VKIVILTGDRECEKCRKAKEIVARVVEPYPSAEVELLRADSPEAAHYGVVMVPTVAIDDTIVSSGRPPNEKRLRAFVESELGSPAGD